jgi:2-oxoglutarate dehydrogenase E2 component (dihydrolipoamide succinyltransferase)
MIEVKVPAVGESITEGSIGEWLKKSGEYVNQGDEIVSLETDKASVEVVAEASGVLTTTVDEGETVEIGAVIGTIDTSAEAPAGGAGATQESAPAAQPAAPAAQQAQTASTDMQNHLPPAAARIAAEKGLSGDQIQGTGKGGRITKQDAANASTPAAQAPAPAPSAPSMPVPKFSKQGEVERKKMSRLRQTIARNLKGVQNTAAILTTYNEVNMKPLMDLRAQYKDQFKEKYGISFGFMGMFTKACTTALQEWPAVNGVIDGDEIIYHNYYNVGIAVGTEKGLVVPVIKDADQMEIFQIEAAIRNYALKARDGKIGVDDMMGGTFTITNGGVFGSLMSSPILNPGQSAILGMHKIEDRPVVENGEIVIRPMMYLALSYDHRIIDGKEAVSFLVRVKECVEDPQRMLLGI